MITLFFTLYTAALAAFYLSITSILGLTSP
jgi:hypothetical protein